MISKVLAVSLIAAGCVVAAAGGAFVAVRQNTPAPAVTESPASQPAAPADQAAGQPVAETEAVVQPAPSPAAAEPARQPVATEARAPQVLRMPERRPAPQNGAVRASNRPATQAPADAAPAAPVHTPERAVITEPAATPAVPAVETPVSESQRPQDPPPAPPVPELEELVVPAGSVIGLQVTTALSTERSQVEDRVEARVTRDVTAAGRVAIPAGSRALGSVTVVERGGKMKERARLGVRFHTLVLADGSEVALRTDSIFREGQSPTGESARKIGGAAVGGAILGAILGGGKGAAIGGATGAAGGAAVVMAGDRNAALLAAGETVTVRLTSPVSVEVRKDK